MGQKTSFIVGITFLNLLFSINSTRRQINFRHTPAYNGRKCESKEALFEYEVSSHIVCSLVCVEVENCVGVFYSESLMLCTGCGHFDVGDLVESAEDMTYFSNCADSVSLSYFNGSYYKLFTSVAEFDQAKRYCRDQFCGWLVHFDNTEEVQFVNNMAQTLGVSNYAIGLKYNTTDSTWRWVDDNMKPSFTHWGPSEPNGEHEYCAAAYGQVSFKWIDLTCRALPYVCEK